MQNSVESSTRLSLSARSGRSAILIAALVTALTGVVLLMFCESLRDFSFDLPTVLRSPISVSNTVVIYMDDESHKRLGQDGLWDRRLHAELVRKLAVDRPSAIVFDVDWSLAWTNAQADDALASAITNAGNVVIAARTEDSAAQGLITRIPRTPLDKFGTNWGVPRFPGREDKPLRIHPWDPEYPTLVERAATVAKVPVKQTSRRKWLRYYGPAMATPWISYHRVLSNDFPHGFFSNRVVFVGFGRLLTSEGMSGDLWLIPHTHRTGQRMFGAELHATALLNMIRGDWLVEVPAPIQLISVILIGGFLGTLLMRFRLIPGIIAALVIAAVVLAFSFWLFYVHSLWLSWAVIVCVQAPLALSCSSVRHVVTSYREKHHLERQLQRIVAAQRDEAVPTIDPQPIANELGVPLPNIPDHTLVKRIGSGAYGEVWLAKNAIGTHHAVKVVSRQALHSKPFDREFSGIQKFTPISRQHPHLVHILHVGRNDPDGYFYYIMELADGIGNQMNIVTESYAPKNLAQELAVRRRLPLKECIQLGLALADALRFLHQRNLIHRDIKPANIIYVGGLPKLADIGLVTEVASPGREVTYLGTRGYIPPEGPGTASADIFSLGKVLYEASMGLDRENFPALPDTLLEGRAEIGLGEMNQLILRSCESDPSKRYRTAADLHTDLVALQQKLSSAS